MMLAEPLVWPSPGPEIRGESYPGPAQTRDCPAPGRAWAELYGYEPWVPTRGVVMSESIRVGHFISIL